MKMRFFAILLLGVFAATGYAGSRTKDTYKTQFKDGTFSATLKEGFHFNAKAPNSISAETESMKPTLLEARLIEFKGVPENLSKTGRAALYICDDAVTFCETEFVALTGQGVKVPQVSPGRKELPRKTTTGKAKPNKHGFFEDAYAEALALAQEENRLLLIDFSARWCPGCIRLEKETFPLKEFKAMTAEYVKLKIDTDRFENQAVAEKFKLLGIPSLIVINGRQEEISRVYDYQPLDVLKGFFAAINLNSESLAELKSKAASGDQAIMLELGKRLLAANDSAGALQYLSQVKPVPTEYLRAQVDAAAKAYEKDSNKDAYVKALRDAIKAEPESTRSLPWRKELAALASDKAEAAKIAAEGTALADAWLNDRAKMQAALKTDMAGEFTGFEALYIGYLRADLADYPGADAAAVTAAWKRTGETGLKMGIPFEKTATNIRLLNALIRGQMLKEADKLSLALMKLNPGNSEIQRRRLKVLSEQKKFEEVADLGPKVLKGSYGRNEIWVAESIAKAYVELGRKKEARKLIDTYLGRDEIRWESMAASRKNFEDLKVKVN